MSNVVAVPSTPANDGVSNASDIGELRIIVFVKNLFLNWPEEVTRALENVSSNNLNKRTHRQYVQRL